MPLQVGEGQAQGGWPSESQHPTGVQLLTLLLLLLPPDEEVPVAATQSAAAVADETAAVLLLVAATPACAYVCSCTLCGAGISGPDVTWLVGCDVTGGGGTHMPR